MTFQRLLRLSLLLREDCFLLFVGEVGEQQASNWIIFSDEELERQYNQNWRSWVLGEPRIRVGKDGPLWINAE